MPAQKCAVGTRLRTWAMQVEMVVNTTPPAYQNHCRGSPTSAAKSMTAQISALLASDFLKPAQKLSTKDQKHFRKRLSTAKKKNR